MKIKILITSLFIIIHFLSSRAETPNLAGAWKGPKDLMINLCEAPENEMYVCSCGIFRTFGWAEVTYTTNGDSLILKSEDADSPFEGRFRIESENILTGYLSMGNPGEDWYFNGDAELIRQKPEMPDNLNPGLKGIILPTDYGSLSRDRKIVGEVLSTMSTTSYGYGEKAMVEKLLEAKTYPVTPESLIGFKRVRSIQIDGRYGIFSYPYFNCRFRKIDGKVFFEKTTGSQRKSGLIYQNTPESLIFHGGWSVNNDPQTAYGSSNSTAGIIYKIGQHKAIMIFPTEENRVEIYELSK